MGVKDEIRPVRPGFSGTLAVLSQLSGGQRIPDVVVQGLARLLPSQMPDVAVVWPSLLAEVRRDVMSALVTAAESDFELDFALFAQFALTDSDDEVRMAAIELLSEDVSTNHLRRLLGMAKTDSSELVRAAAIKGLGPLVLETELGKLPAKEVEPVLAYLLSLLRAENVETEIRACALETFAHSSHPEVNPQIRRAYDSGDSRMRAAALFAMGASSDEDAWAEVVIENLTNRRSEYRYEAARAAGELVLAEAVQKLAHLALEDEGQVRNMAVWALGEIGGKEAIRVLDALLERADEEEDDELVDLVEEALDSASAAAGQIYGLGDDLLDS